MRWESLTGWLKLQAGWASADAQMEEWLLHSILWLLHSILYVNYEQIAVLWRYDGEAEYFILSHDTMICNCDKPFADRGNFSWQTCCRQASEWEFLADPHNLWFKMACADPSFAFLKHLFFQRLFCGSDFIKHQDRSVKAGNAKEKCCIWDFSCCRGTKCQRMTRNVLGAWVIDVRTWDEFILV